MATTSGSIFVQFFRGAIPRMAQHSRRSSGERSATAPLSQAVMRLRLKRRQRPARDRCNREWRLDALAAHAPSLAVVKDTILLPNDLECWTSIQGKFGAQRGNTAPRRRRYFRSPKTPEVCKTSWRRPTQISRKSFAMTIPRSHFSASGVVAWKPSVWPSGPAIVSPMGPGSELAPPCPGAAPASERPFVRPTGQSY
jgi:hypothetical protein